LAAGLLLRPSWRRGLRERLGARPRLAPGAVWVHGAGLGELRAAAALVGRLRAGGHRVCTSATGLRAREAARAAHPEVPCHLAPLDHPWCVEAALARVQPAALVLLEAELWPGWIAAAHRRGAAVLVLSGRVSERSLRRQRSLRRFLAPTLARVDAIGARTEADAERFCLLGAPPERVVVTGDLKLDALDLPPPALADDLARILGEVPLLVAGSVYREEEEAALAALEHVEGEGLEAALALVPRRPERAGEILRRVRRTGRACRLRSQAGAAPLAPGEVLVVDSLGELAGLYARAAVAFVGGSFVRIGGHNLLEPVAAGRPVLFGPHTAEVEHAVCLLEGCGAGRRLAAPAQLGPAFAEWLRDPQAARARGEAGRAALLAQRGSAARSAKLVEAALAARKV
jgi:3-deoxy-D-manno-octulosonic-acid transferase